MKVMSRVASGTGAAVLLTALLAAGSSASATVSGAVPWTSANFSGYANGTEAHVDALTIGTTKLADVEQGFSGATTGTAGLTGVHDNELGVVVQPAQSSSVKSYGRGSGLEAGVGTSTAATTDPNQIILAGLAQSTAPPNGALVEKTAGPINVSPLVNASLLTGRAATFFDAAECPVGQPLSYGFGNAANANLLTLPALTGGGPASPVVNTAGSGTSTAQTISDTYLSQNSDQTYGLAASSSDIIAPVTLNVLGLAVVKIAVHSAGGVNDPVTLTAKATGESSGASVKLSSDDIITATIQVAGGQPMSLLPNGAQSIPVTGVGAHGVHIDLNLNKLNVVLNQIDTALSNLATSAGIPQLGSLLSSSPVTSLLGQVGSSLSSGLTAAQLNLDLGRIDIDVAPHAIGQDPSTAPTITGGTAASGAIDLVRVHLGVTGTIANQPVPTQIGNLANLAVGHLEAAANLAAPVQCNLPVTKTSSVNTVTAGGSFTYSIDVPNLADVNSLTCDLKDMTVTDTISDAEGSPTFIVTSAQETQGGSAAGSISPVTASSTPVNQATVTWTGLSWTRGSPPDVLTIHIHVPAGTVQGRIQDTVVATATVSGCTGGVSGDTNVANASNGSTLTGTFTLQQPAVTVAAAKPPSALPFTGAMGGPWQPIAGVAVLGLGGGALALGLRARRRRLG